jgi:prophage regulatory protein
VSSPTFSFLALPEVCRAVGLRKTSLYARIAAGSFPAPCKVGPRASRWRSDAVQAWMESQQPEARFRSIEHENAPAVAAEASISARL